jgi:hypothetical protein
MLLSCPRPLAAATASAADGPIPKVLSDAPMDKGSWRMEMLEMPGRDAKARKPWVAA